jgi:phage/plasmid-associated DNA primase
LFSAQKRRLHCGGSRNRWAHRVSRRDNDPVGQFIEDRCEQVAAARVSTKVLYDNFEGWRSANCHDLIPISEFGKILGRKKFQKKKVSGGLSGWLGLQLNLAEKMKTGRQPSA